MIVITRLVTEGSAGLPPAGSHQLCLAHSFDHLVGDSEHARRSAAFRSL